MEVVVHLLIGQDPELAQGQPRRGLAGADFSAFKGGRELSKLSNEKHSALPATYSGDAYPNFECIITSLA